MPPLDQTDPDSESDSGEIPFDPSKADDGAKEQLNGELGDKVTEVEEKAARKTKSKASSKSKTEPETEAADESTDAGGDGEDVFSVESIVAHRWRKGVLEYQIKWVGYDESENTYEPEENLLPDAAELLAAYHETLGGIPEPPKGAKRKSTQSLREDSTPATKRHRVKESREDDGYRPKTSNWDSEIQCVEAVERDENGNLKAFLLFKNGKRTKIGNELVYNRCPISMLKFYESHLKFSAIGQ